jgi:hypothetical protein
MGSLRFADLQTRPTEVLDLTSLTLEECQQLVPPFEVAFQAHMAHWRLDGQPRTARRYTTYTNCPLPTPEDRLPAYPGLLENLPPSGGTGAAVRDGSKQGPSMDSCPLGGAAGNPAHAGGCPQPILDGIGPAHRGGRGQRGRGGRVTDHVRSARDSASTGTRLPPFGHDGTERRIEHPQDPTEQTRCYTRLWPFGNGALVDQARADRCCAEIR